MRAIVIGTSGTGKTTFARQLAQAVGAPHTEMDALHWGPDWTPHPLAQFRAAVDAASAGARWVIDGNYTAVRDLLWPRATHIVWLDYSRLRVFSQVLRRTLRRGVRQTPLWAGNRESLRRTLFTRGSILRWSWDTFEKNRRAYTRLRDGNAYPQLQWLEFRRPAEARAWLRRIRKLSQ